jgi:hypothetical protein
MEHCTALLNKANCTLRQHEERKRINGLLLRPI